MTPGRSHRRPSSANAIAGSTGRSRAAPALAVPEDLRRLARSPPVKKVRRRNTACALRSAIICWMNRRKPAFGSANVQSTQLVALSWHQALLLPLGSGGSRHPQDHRHALRISNVAIRFRTCRSRKRLTIGSSDGPSTPQFQLRLALLPSRFPSPLASLCFWLYETRSASVKPSWQQRKLIEWKRSAALVEVVAAADPRRERRGRPRFASPESTDVVAVLAVPVGPSAASGESAHLVESGRVPGLGDQLGAVKQRVFGDPIDRRRVDQHVAASVSAQNRGEVEPETVHAGLGHPAAQARQEEVADDRIVAVEGVAATGVVLVAPVLVEHVVEWVVEPPEVVCRPLLTPFGRVIEDDVEDHLDSALMERRRPSAEFFPGLGPARFEA